MPPLPLNQLAEVVAMLMAHLRSARPTLRRDALACLLGLHGLRNQEVCNLRRDDWDPKTRRLHVKTLKGGPRRWIPIEESVAVAIDTHLSSHSAPWLLSTRTGGKLDTRNLRRRWKEWILPLCGNYRFHDLRHTTAHAMRAGGAEVWDIQNQLRHAKLENTLLYLRDERQLRSWLPTAVSSRSTTPPTSPDSP